MMKYSLFFAVLFCGVILYGATNEGDGEKKLQEQTSKLSLRLLLADWKSKFASDGFSAGTDRIRREMQEKPAENVRIADARKHARAAYEEELIRQYRLGVERILSPFPGVLTNEEKNAVLNGDVKFLQGKADKQFEASFRLVRTELAQKQKQQVFHRIYPTPEELEKYSDPQLLQMLTDRFSKGLSSPLWEENSNLVRRELIEPVIASGRAQQRLQLTLIGRETVPASFWTAQEITGRLESEVRQALAKHYPTADDRYDLFPASKKRIQQRAEEIPVERVMHALPQELPEARYLTMLEEDPRSHKTQAKSFEKTAPVFRDYLIQESLQKTGAPDFIEAQLQTDSALRRAAEKRFHEKEQSLVKVRKTFAQRQLERTWRAVAEGVWIPGMTETEAYVENGAKSLPALEGRPASENLIEETEALLEEKARICLDREAARLAQQRKCVQSLYQAVLDAMEAQQDSRRASAETTWFFRLFETSGKDVQLEEIVKYYREEVIKHSTDPLFPSVEEDIIVRAKAILQKILSPEDEEEKKEEEQEPQEMILTVTLSEQGNKLMLSCESWKQLFTLDRIPESEIAEAIRKRTASIDASSTVRILLVVKGNRIYYRTFDKVRSVLKKAFPEYEIDDSPEP